MNELDRRSMLVPGRATSDHVPVLHDEHAAVCLTRQDFEIQVRIGPHRPVRDTGTIGAERDDVNSLGRGLRIGNGRRKGEAGDYLPLVV